MLEEKIHLKLYTNILLTKFFLIKCNILFINFHPTGLIYFCLLNDISFLCGFNLKIIKLL
jgi:hypothetical protein